MKTLKQITRTAITLLSWIAGIYVLNRFEFLSAMSAIDNVVGMLPVAMVLVGAVGITILCHVKFKKQSLPVFTAIILLVVSSMVLFPVALRGNWWIGTHAPAGAETAPDLTNYAPFSVDSKTAKLSEEATLRLDGHQPVLDGATALYPLYAAFAEAVYEESAFSPDRVICTNTRGAYEAVVLGERDVIFVAGASERQIAAAQAVGAELVFTPIGREAFVFLVGENNPVNNITGQQIRNVYSGKTADWYTLGWPDGGRIIAFQRPEGSGSQTGLQTLMGDLPIQVPQPLPDKSLVGTNSLMRQISVEWNGVQPALGYSYRFYATTMYANPAAKLLSINGVEPSTENIQNGSYPFVADFYAVTNGQPQGDIKLLIDWILSPQGQELVKKTGYTPTTAFPSSYRE